MKTQVHLIVDGNNAIHAIPDLLDILSSDRQAAREGLINLLQPIHDSEGCRLTVVFDGREGIGSIHKHGNDERFCIVYSSSEQSADGAIERMLLAAKRPEAITVATNDNLIRSCAYEVGAAAVRAEDLPRWADRAVSHQQEVLKNVPSLKAAPVFGNRIEIPKSLGSKQ
ncbi:MAG: NYN domain-containing protein [Verrucomicrobia bacterium]|nr:NYN domain-containing protein [Verrucomicrobiota bacterium]